MENYICINGKKAELTEEQLKALGIELPKPSPFERVCNHANEFYEYYFINSYGVVTSTVDRGYSTGSAGDDGRYKAANYCTDKTLLEQRTLHETLNRLLWRYSMEHDGDKIETNDEKHYIYYDYCVKTFDVDSEYYCPAFGITYFVSEEIARGAIAQIVEPFIEAHPDFKW